MVFLYEYLNATTVLVGICVGILSYILYRRIKYTLPPIPRGIPILGNWKGMKELVFLNNYETVMEALLTKKVQFAGRPQTPQTFISTDGSQSIGFSQHNEEWWYRKKVAGKALRYGKHIHVT